MAQVSRLTIEALLNSKLIGDTQIDPAGERVAYVVADNFLPMGAPSAESRIWLGHTADQEGQQTVELTHGPGTDDMPRWSPDGRTLAFRSDRARRGFERLYLLTPGATSEPEPVEALGGPVSAYAWSPNGAQIAAIVTDPPDEREEGADHIVYEDDARYARLWVVDIATQQARQITHGEEHVWEFAWSPDGRSIAIVFSRLPLRNDWYNARLGRVDIESGEVRSLYEPERQIARPAWSPDGSTISLITCTFSDPGMTGGDVVLVPAEGGEARNLTRGGLRSHQSMYWRPDSRSIVSVALERGLASVCELDLRGSVETLWSGEQSFSGFSLSFVGDDLAVGAALASLNAPPEAWCGRIGAETAWSPLSVHNDELAGQVPGEVETIHWQADDGLEIQGLLIRPRGATEGPLPMVTMIHGGPTSAWVHAFPNNGVAAWMPELLRRGVAVLLPNPRGSNAWGVEFAEQNQEDMGGRDLGDILAGIDLCVEQGIADPNRLGVCGWSYGGYLTAWAVTQTDRFKAAVAGASITNWISFHGTSDIPRFDETFYRADPYAESGPYLSMSPIMAVRRARTPTLFVHGERDLICPVGQPMEMFRALRSLGVPTQCVIYPREGHPIRERAHRRDMFERAVDWFCQYLDC